MKLKVIIIELFIIFLFVGCTANNSLQIVNQNNKFGLYNVDTNKTQIPTIYDDLILMKNYNSKNEQFSSKNVFNLHWVHSRDTKEYYIYEYKELYGIISEDNKLIFEPIFSEISDFYQGVAVVKENDKYGYINKKFELIQKPTYSDARDFIEKISFVKSFINNKYACINPNMKLLSDFIYDKVFDFSEGLARVLKDNKWGFINIECKEVIPAKFDFASDFIGGKAKILDGNKSYFIDKNNIK
ncbi:hypothetical protein CRV00_11720 [Malaciobacter molluscorum]|uniref:WG repeat-containing protein n=1 Tax=Malaciobacter molluscorum TaxID=1032072 RepID=UPI00100AC0AD|nr:WG repeat-containing protein [Malaciobacter molluscorum]RXJ93315.1 hypothetical protein CRV00_11720 [Malaciobacter molluscorum]